MQHQSNEVRAEYHPIIRWLQLAAQLSSFVVGAVAYIHHFRQIELGWWRWLIELAIASALWLVGTSGDLRKPAEPMWRRMGRGLAVVLAGASLAFGIDRGLQRGSELESGVALIMALALGLVSRWIPIADSDAARLLPPQPLPAFTRAAVVAAGLSVLLCGLSIATIPSQHALGFALWLGCLAVLAYGARRSDVAAGGEVSRRFLISLGRYEAMALLAVVLLAAVLRYPMLAEIPALIDADEGRLGASAMKMLEDGFPNVFDFGWNSFPNLSYLVDYAFIPILGEGYVQQRMAAATIGVLSVIPMYFWVRRWWGITAALIAAFLLAVTHDLLFWSRMGFNNIHSVALGALMLATLARAFQRGAWIDYFWFGLVTGLCFHTYHAAKLYGLLLAVSVLPLALGVRGLARRHFAGALLSLLTFVVVVAPQVPSIVENWETFRTDTMNRNDVHELIAAYRAHDVQRVRDHLYTHVADSLNVFISVPHRLAFFEPAVCVPFLIGFFWMLWRWRDPRHLVVLVWLIGVVVIGGMMTSYPPYKPRLIGMLPAACVIPAALAARLRDQFRRVLPGVGDMIALPLLGSWLAVVGYQNWYTQFIYLREQQSVDVASNLCRLLPTLPTPAIVYTLGADVVLNPRNALNDCLLKTPKGVTLINLPNDPDVLPLPTTHRGHALILVSRFQEELLPLVRFYYPEAREDTWQIPNLLPEMHLFSIDAGVVERSQSLRATYRSEAGVTTPPLALPLDGRAAAFRVPADMAFPARATWEGQVYIAESGEYAFGVNQGRINVGWEAYTKGWDSGAGAVSARLQAGWQPIRIEAPVASATESIAISWRPLRMPYWVPLQRSSLSNHSEPIALRGIYRHHLETAPGVVARPTDEHLHPSLSFEWRYMNDDDPPAWFVQAGTESEWRAVVELAPGNHPLRLDTTDPTEVYINDRLVLHSRGGDERPIETTLEQVQGSVHLRVHSQRPLGFGERWRVRLLWGEPGGGWTAFARYRPD